MYKRSATTECKYIHNIHLLLDRSATQVLDAVRGDRRRCLGLRDSPAVRCGRPRRQFCISALNALSHLRPVHGPLRPAQLLPLHDGVRLRAGRTASLRAA